MEITNETFMAAVADACRAGIESERERIIKLLEASAMAWSEDCAMPIDWKHCQNCWQMASLIALIKGEK